MNFDLANFQPVKTTNTRKDTKPRGQNFKLRYRKFMSKLAGLNFFIHVSDKLWDELGLEEKAMIQLSNPATNQMLLALVDNENGTIFNHSNKQKESGMKKGRKFKSTIIEDALASAGLIDVNLQDKSQKLDLVKVAENVEIGGVHAYQVFQVVVDTVSGDDAEDEADNAEAENATQTEAVTETAPIANEDVASQATAPEAEDEDEF